MNTLIADGVSLGRGAPAVKAMGDVKVAMAATDDDDDDDDAAAAAVAAATATAALAADGVPGAGTQEPPSSCNSRPRALWQCRHKRHT